MFSQGFALLLVGAFLSWELIGSSDVQYSCFNSWLRREYGASKGIFPPYGPVPHCVQVENSGEPGSHRMRGRLKGPGAPSLHEPRRAAAVLIYLGNVSMKASEGSRSHRCSLGLQAAPLPSSMLPQMWVQGPETPQKSRRTLTFPSHLLRPPQRVAMATC